MFFYDSIEDLKFNLQQTLKRLYEQMDSHDYDDIDSAYFQGKIDAYEDILGEL